MISAGIIGELLFVFRRMNLIFLVTFILPSKLLKNLVTPTSWTTWLTVSHHLTSRIICGSFELLKYVFNLKLLCPSYVQVADVAPHTGECSEGAFRRTIAGQVTAHLVRCWSYLRSTPQQKSENAKRRCKLIGSSSRLQADIKDASPCPLHNKTARVVNSPLSRH